MIEISLLMATCVPFFGDCNKNERIQMHFKSHLRENFQVQMQCNLSEIHLMIKQISGKHRLSHEEMLL